MSLYEFLLFVHIIAAAVWFGAGILMQVLAYRAETAGDGAAMKRLLDDNVALANTFFAPSAMIVLIAGILLTIDGPWSLNHLWIVLGLAGFLATFVTGVGLIEPRAKRIAVLAEREGATSPRVLYETRKLLALARIDSATLLCVIAVMAIKPTGSDVAVLVALAVLLFGGSAFFVLRANAFPAPAAQEA